MVLALEAGKQVTLVVAVGGFLTKKMFNLNNWNRLDGVLVIISFVDAAVRMFAGKGK